ncbi:ATP-dependent Clp protease adaptor ClpS [Desulfovibrio litoralis]|uniref:ATP-dependent Clp protease adapter protein ClpS n=1 Tax=Desulfovibrio litoralis DSM 11393 TaxID=1121455 RepID=A0A1M7RXI3_9BACT|nr:ATP-dependent Clp protease adaptor ClpS [Desulfovibrio litoralis]SHN51019.1 ATP-dependent Clp protease adaptor protein ClpS [Desulfovibrio litoralis DSM 11393]
MTKKSIYDLDKDFDSLLDNEILLENELKEPLMFRVLLHNDDYTSMYFVTEILMEIFKKTSEEARNIMLTVHKKGIGECGIYTFEIAETKVMLVKSRAKKANFPLLCTMEEI